MSDTTKETGLLTAVREFPANVWSSIFRNPLPSNDLERASTSFTNFFLHVHPVKVNRNTLRPLYTLGLGLMSFFLFLILVVTGVLLMFYYVPSTTQAYDRMLDLRGSVAFGIFLRNMHRWSAHGMVAIVFLHMCRVFFTGAYKKPREFNWVLGVGLLLVTLFLSFTGYLLPWDQLAFWAITVGTSIAGYAPLVGKQIQFLLLGDTTVGQEALLRFYVLHVFFLPVFVLVLFAYHMWRVRKDGGLAAIERVRHERAMAPKAISKTKSYSLFGITPGTSVQVMSSTGLEESDQVFSSPNMSRRIARVFLIVFNITLLAALLFNAPLEGLANPSVTPNPAKAPWYFVWLQELVASTTVRMGGFTISGALLGGILLPGFLLAVLTLWPWLDRSPLRTEGRWLAPERKRQNATFAVATLVIIVLIMVGVYLRGPYWRIYWPGQPRPEIPQLY